MKSGSKILSSGFCCGEVSRRSLARRNYSVGIEKRLFADQQSRLSRKPFEDRKRPLPVYGPPGNDFMPSTTEFVRDLFSEPHGAWRYLSELVEPGAKESYTLEPHDVTAGSKPVLVFQNSAMVVYAVRVIHGGFPALGWRVEIGGKRIVFSGDTSGEGDGLTQLALDADLFVAHNAVPEGATGVERRLHMPPSVIGTIAANARVKRLILSHRMLRTLGRENETQAEIQRHYSGPIVFANESMGSQLRSQDHLREVYGSPAATFSTDSP